MPSLMANSTAHSAADLTAQSLALQQRVLGSEALTSEILSQITQRNPALNAFLHVDATAALAAAKASDARRAAGQSLGPLDGLTFAVKDNIDVAGMPTTAGMATRRGRIAEQDATVVQRLRAAGMVLLGKLNMHEAALGATTDNPFYGRCENPLRVGHTPGGSSGGSASAVAAGLCALALGTDTMGSVRIPAAYCGVIGYKGSFDAVPTHGTVACGYALDHVGPVVRAYRDLALVWPVLTGQVLAQALPGAPRWAVVADVATLGATPLVARAYARAVQNLRARGDAVAEIDISGYDFGRARRAGLLAVEADLLRIHAEDWRDQPHNFSPELAKLLRYGQRQSEATFSEARATLFAAKAEVQRWLTHGDVLLLPTAPQAAFAFGTPVPANQADFTAPANMAGVPALTVPLPAEAGELPVGLQCIAPAGDDALLLNLNLTGVLKV
jgi:Asp-tRNA(Asn)/Glu-tRNA(Gln) amidotransferase A subunit family amidase